MLILPVLAAGSLAGCAGYASDYWKPKAALIAPQLARYGMADEQGRCVETALTGALTVWQLRQLSDFASRLTPGGTNPTSFGPRDFVHIAGLVEDPKVRPETLRALQGCGIDPESNPGEPAAASQGAAAASPPAPVGDPAASPAPAGTAPAASEPLWVNLGAAQTGQGIAVDASSVTRGPGWRQAWFRLLNPDRSDDIGYLLRIECPTRRITAHAGRKYAADGTLAEQKDYPAPEGPMGIETGTVIEVAYHALCDDPR